MNDNEMRTLLDALGHYEAMQRWNRSALLATDLERELADRKIADVQSVRKQAVDRWGMPS